MSEFYRLAVIVGTTAAVVSGVGWNMVDRGLCLWEDGGGRPRAALSVLTGAGLFIGGGAVAALCFSVAAGRLLLGWLPG